MYKNGHSNDDDDAAGAALIDSFFLPGGILDPEGEASNSDKNDAVGPSTGSGTGSGSGSNLNRGRFSQAMDPTHGLPQTSLGMNNTDSLRSRLDQIAIGGQALEYDFSSSSNNNPSTNAGTNRRSSAHSAITMPRSGTTKEPTRVGVSALDPTGDDVLGGMPIMLNSPTSIPVSSPPLHSQLPPVSSTVTGAQFSGQHQRSSQLPNLAQSSESWFSDSAPSNANVNVNVSTQNDEFANFLRGALQSQSQNNSSNNLLPLSSSRNTQASHVPGNAQRQPPYSTRASYSTSSNESRTTSATSHVRRNPWSNEDLQKQQHQQQSSHLQYGSSPYTVPEPVEMGLDALSPSNQSLSNFQATSRTTNPLASSNPLHPQHSISSLKARPSVNDGILPATATQPSVSVSVRPPPGFLPSSAQPQQQLAPSSVPKQRSVPVQEQTESLRQGHSLQRSSDRRTTGQSRSMRHGDNTNGNQNSYRHEHELANLNVNVQQPKHEQHQQSHQHHSSSANVNVNAHVPRKSKAVHHNDGDYDQSSLNTKSSRDVPSTIYVEEDAVSTSEDTLTVCADSVTDVSVQKPAVKMDNERTCMDVVEEASAIEQQKRNKPKRNKKKRTKKKQNQNQNVQESTKSQDTPPRDTPQDTIMSGDVNQQKSDSEDESKGTKKTPKPHNKPLSSKKGSGLKSQTHSRSSAATTAISSTATTVHRSAKRSHNPQPTNVDRSLNIPDDRDNNREIDVTPREPLSESFSKWLQKVIPVVVNLFRTVVSFINSTGKFVASSCMSFFPRKERFWFFFPAFCVMFDFFFLACAIIAKASGQTIYMIVMLHKLALLELMESDSAAICYTVIYFYPNIVSTANATIPYKGYWQVFVRWLAIDRWLCRAITMKDTYLYRLKLEDRRREAEMNPVENYLRTGSLKNAVDHHRRTASNHDELEESERVTMTNHILLILRKMTPLILILEINIRREGFLVLMTSTERILFGYGFAVLRSGYLFSPLIWISWTIQLTIIMFVVPSPSWSYFIFLIGLVSIRLSHYTAAVEDLEGINAVNRNATSRLRKKANNL